MFLHDNHVFSKVSYFFKQNPYYGVESGHAIVQILYKKLGNLGKHMVSTQKPKSKPGKPKKTQCFRKDIVLETWKTLEHTTKTNCFHLSLQGTPS